MQGPAKAPTLAGTVTTAIPQSTPRGRRWWGGRAQVQRLLQHAGSTRKDLASRGLRRKRCRHEFGGGGAHRTYLNEAAWPGRPFRCAHSIGHPSALKGRRGCASGGAGGGAGAAAAAAALSIGCQCGSLELLLLLLLLLLPCGRWRVGWEVDLEQDLGLRRERRPCRPCEQQHPHHPCPHLSGHNNSNIHSNRLSAGACSGSHTHSHAGAPHPPHINTHLRGCPLHLIVHAVCGKVRVPVGEARGCTVGAGELERAAQQARAGQHARRGDVHHQAVQVGAAAV